MSDSILKLFLVLLLAFVNNERIFSLTYSRKLDTVNENMSFTKKSGCVENTLEGSKVVYLTPNLVNGKNMLTQDMLSKSNTRYVIQYDYDLQGAEITIPEGCVLDFQGGSINNGTIVFQNTSIIASRAIFGINLSISGKVLQEASPEWFDGSDADKIERAIDVFSVVKLAARDYVIDRQINIKHSFSLLGSSIPDMFGNRFGQNNVSDYSQTRLIASTLKEGDAILSITKNDVSRYMSASIDHVSFTADKQTSRAINGINWSTPGGPSRPFSINCCNFKGLNYGLYIYGSTSDTSTNLSNVSIRSTTMVYNNWGIFVEGRHGIMSLNVDTSVIEQNVLGGIYVDDNDYESLYGTLSVRCCLLEGQPIGVQASGIGFVNLEGNYFERGTEQQVVIKGKASTRPIVSILGNIHSSSGDELFTYNISGCIVKNLRDVGGLNFNVNLQSCRLQNEINGVIGSIKKTSIEYDLDNKIYTEPMYVFGITPNYIYKNTPCLLSAQDGLSRETHNVNLKAGTYRFVFYAYNSTENSTLYIRDVTNAIDKSTSIPPSSGVCLFIHDVTFDVDTDKLYIGRNNKGVMYVSPIFVYNIDSKISVPDIALGINSYLIADILNPSNGNTGYDYISKKKVVYNNGRWTDGNGNTPAVSFGDSENRPTSILNVIYDKGFQYFDTNVNKTIFLSNTEVKTYTTNTPSEGGAIVVDNPCASNEAYRVSTSSRKGYRFIFGFSKTKNISDGVLLVLFDNNASNDDFYVKSPNPQEYPYLYVYSDRPYNIKVELTHLVKRWVDAMGDVVE